MSDFELFKATFKYWIDKLNLAGWQVYYKEEDLEDSFAEIRCNLTNMVATVALNNNLTEKDIPFKDVEKSAKHEAMHLLLARLSENGKARCVASAELYEAEEELVNKLEKLIQ